MGRKKVRGLNKKMVCEVCGSSTAHLERKNDHRHTRTCSRECKAELISKSKTVIDQATGLSKAKIGWLKAAETKRSNIVNGEDAFVRAAKKASAKMARDGTRAVAIEKWRSTMVFDEAHSEKIRVGMAKIGPDGLTAAQRGAAAARASMIASGRFVDPSTLPAFKQYQRRVHHLTRIQDLSSLPNFEKRGVVENDGWHIDHRFSITDGFLQGASPEEVSNIANLMMLPAKENIKKSVSSTMSLQELRALIS
jgi:hypothetical protein